MKRTFLNIVYTLVAVVLMQNIVLAQTFKFAQVTDLRLKDDSETFNKIVKDINHTKGLEFVIFSGDNIGRATPTLLKNFLTGARKLNKPYYVSLGTKDVSKTNKMSKKTYIETVRKYNSKQPKNTNFVFKKKNLVFVVVDGSKEIVPSNNGYYTPDTIAWVDKQLSQYSQNKVIILQYYPVGNKPDNELYVTYNSLEYLKMLHKHKNVLAVVSGHYRKNEEVMFDGINHITTPEAVNGKYKIIEVDLDTNDIFTIVKDVK